MEYKRINVVEGPACDISEYASLENVVLGKGVRIGEGVQLKNVVIGDSTKISVNVRFYSRDPNRPVRIGKSVWLSYGVFGEATGGEIQIEDYVTIAHATKLLTSSGPGKNNPIMDYFYPEEDGDIYIGKHSWIGTDCLILPNVRLPEGNVVGTHSFLRGSVAYKPWAVYMGIPAEFKKDLDPERIFTAKKKLGL